jgi:hypothetical protein
MESVIPYVDICLSHFESQSITYALGPLFPYPYMAGLCSYLCGFLHSKSPGAVVDFPRNYWPVFLSIGYKKKHL